MPYLTPAMNTYWLCLSLSVYFRFSWSQNDQKNFSVLEFEENIKSLTQEFSNEEKSSEEKKLFENYVVSRTRDFNAGLVLQPISLQEVVLEMIGQLLEERKKDDPHEVHGLWSAFITSVGEDSGIDLEKYGENIGENVMEMSSQDPLMQDTAMSISSSLVSTIGEKNDPNTKNATSPHGSRTKTLSRSISAGTKVYKRKRPLLSLPSRRKKCSRKRPIFLQNIPVSY